MYNIRDIDRAFIKYLEENVPKLREEGMNVRIPVLPSYDESVIVPSYPLIEVNCGYTIDSPIDWQTCPDKECVLEDIVDITVNEITTKKITMEYSFLISAFVKYREQARVIEEFYLRKLPNKFILRIPFTGGEESLVFIREPKILNLDDLVEQQRVFRRDVVVTVLLSLEERTVEQFMRPFNGVNIEIQAEEE